jgi:hypothetical protein
MTAKEAIPVVLRRLKRRGFEPETSNTEGATFKKYGRSITLSENHGRLHVAGPNGSSPHPIPATGGFMDGHIGEAVDMIEGRLNAMHPA